jgi:hypothetical protein
MKFYCTIGFYISYGFQRDIICYFSSYRSKVMNFTRFNWILVWNFHLDRFNSRLGHVASSYWSIPVRLDHELRPLELMLIGRTRCLHTGSLKWINPGHRINIGRARFIRRELTWLGLGFRRIFRRGRAEVELRRASGEVWVTALPRRASARQGGLGSLVGVLDCVLQRGGDAAGVALGGDELRVVVGSSICCRFWWTKGMRRGARGSRRR